MIEVRLYGNLRRFAENREAMAESIAWVPWHPEDTVETVLKRVGIDPDREVSNIFVNGRYSYLARQIQVNDGDRLGVFPKNMGMLYC